MSIFDHIFGGGGGGGFFEQAGGHPFAHQEEEDKEPVNTTEYYDIVGCEKNADQDTIKKAYRKQARKLHPDRHPTEKDKYQAKFQDLQKAFEVLSDKHKRGIYDKHGPKGLERGGGGGAHNIFDMFSGKKPQNSGPKKSPKISTKIQVTLSDFYHGTTKQLSIKRFTCSESTKGCPECNGNGTIQVTRRMGNMILSQETQCSSCRGQGYVLPTETVKIDVHIPCGARHGETITIPNSGHKYPDHQQGDVTVRLLCKNNTNFNRRGADLGITHVLSLREALTRYTLRLQHISGKNLLIRPLNKNEIVQPGSLKRVCTLGMPQRFSPHIKGHLYIQVEVKMPLYKHIGLKVINDMKKALPYQKIEQEYKEPPGIHQDEKKQSTNTKNKPNKNKKKPSFGANLSKKMNNKRKFPKKKSINSMETDSKEEEEGVLYAEPVKGQPKATPAAAKQYQQADDGQGENVQCRQM